MKKSIKIVLITALTLLSGCTITTPSKAEYRISPRIEVQSNEESSCKEKSLKIAQAFSASSLMSTKMKYTYDEAQEFTYTESAWSRSPSRAITAALLSSVRGTHLFKSVNSYKSRSRSNLILETNIEEFIQHYEEENQKSFVKVIISFSLVDSKTSKIIDTETISVKVDTKSLNAEGGAVALNSALDKLLIKNNEWLGSLCR